MAIADCGEEKSSFQPPALPGGCGTVPTSAKRSRTNNLYNSDADPELVTRNPKQIRMTKFQRTKTQLVARALGKGPK